MKGKVAIEESFCLPRLKEQERVALKHFAQEDIDTHVELHCDITGVRLDQCDEFGIGMTILSYTSSGVQGVKDKNQAEAFATEINDYIAGAIRGYEHRYQAFAALSMHDPKQAANELRRCVSNYGFKGALVNDYQISGPDGEDFVFYDQPEYDEFWSVCEELDVPFYLHPIIPTGQYFDRWYKPRKWLMGPSLSFANGVSCHLLGMVVNGVFDRHPKLQVVIGHLGEHVVGDIWRINHFLEDVMRHKDLPCKKSLRDYFASNIWISTSGFFSQTMLNMAIAEVGADRILFAVDYPFERNRDGAPWFDKVEISQTDRLKIGRENAKKLFKLQEYKDCNSEEIAPQRDQK